MYFWTFLHLFPSGVKPFIPFSTSVDIKIGSDVTVHIVEDQNFKGLNGKH